MGNERDQKILQDGEDLLHGDVVITPGDGYDPNDAKFMRTNCESSPFEEAQEK